MNQNQEALRKAAVLVGALDTAAADALLERMSPEQAAAIRRMLVEMADVGAGEEQAIIGEFLGRDATSSQPEASGVELELSGTEPDHDDDRETIPFRFLHEAAKEDLGELLAGERPQTIAVVVSHLPPGQAAETLAALPRALQTEVVRRLARLDETDPLILREVEAGLERRFRRRVPLDGRRSVGVGAVRQILNVAAPETRQQWLTNLSRQDPPLAEKLTRPTFTFAELDRLTDESLALVFATVDDATAVAALAGCEPAFMSRLTTILPRARAQQLRRGVDTLGPTRLSDVDAAQEASARTAHDLEIQGRLTWRDGTANTTFTESRAMAA